MENKKKVYVKNLIKGVYTQESIHEIAYWKRRELIEKKSYECVNSARKEQTEREEEKTIGDTLSMPKEQEEQKGTTSDIATTDSEQTNQGWKGLTLTDKEARHDQRNRRKRIETKNKLVRLETIPEGRNEEEYSGETFTERYTRYKQACGIVDTVLEQKPMSDEEECHDQRQREKVQTRLHW